MSRNLSLANDGVCVLAYTTFTSIKGTIAQVDYYGYQHCNISVHNPFHGQITSKDDRICNGFVVVSGSVFLFSLHLGKEAPSFRKIFGYGISPFFIEERNKISGGMPYSAPLYFLFYPASVTSYLFV